MASKALIPFLVTMMLVTGVCNTLLTKYQDMQCVRNCDSPDPKERHAFEQPVIQTVQMFIGEVGCWLVVFGFWLYRRYLAPTPDAPLLAGGYQPVSTDGDPDSAIDDSENAPLRHSITSQDEENPVVKAFVSNHEDRSELRGWRVVLLAAPACCDIAGTTLMNVGLLFVAASIYQMTRGALVLFVGLFSVLFLRRRLYFYQWFALFVAVIGVGLVGLAGALFKDSKAVAGSSSVIDTQLPEMDAVTHGLISVRDAAVGVMRTPGAVQTVVGVLLIAGAQIFTATQFVLEEWILENYALQPLKVVGWEGLFGLLVTLVGMVILHFSVGRTDAGRYGYFDAREGWREISTNRALAVSSILTMISIGGFNFFGLSVTRTVSATSRSTIDTCRTLFIWMVSLALGWETFKWLQIVGFALLVYGTFLFNDIVRPPLKACLPSSARGEEGRPRRRSLLEEEPIEHM